MLKQILLTIVLIAAAGTGARAEPPVGKILFIGKPPDHSFGTHMYLHTSKVLAACIRVNGDFETVVSDGWPQDRHALQNVRTIVVYTTPAAEFLLDGPHRADFTDLMKRGTGLVTIHWASSIYQRNLDRLGPTWMSLMGATWISNVGLHTGSSRLKQLTPDHPVCRGWKPFDLHDEYYLNPRIGPATPLLEVMARDQPVTVGWTYERSDGGRSFGTTLGHFYRNFQREPFRRMIVNGILWTARSPLPDDGANVDLPESDLALPSRPEK